MTAHACPRCELRFGLRNELVDHLDRDHGVVFDEPAPVVQAPVERPPAIVLAVDRDDDPDAPIGASAVALARQAGSPLQIVTVADTGAGRSRADRVLADRVARASADGVDADHAVLASSAGSVSRAVAEHGHRAGWLLALATRARSAVGEAVLGSVSEAVLRTADVPVLLAGPEARPIDRVERVVVAVDGSDTSEQALAPAVDLAGRLGLPVRLVTVLGEAPLPDDVSEAAYVSRVADALGGLDFDVLHGRRAADAIAGRVNGTPGTLAVLATHGRSALRRVAAGSTALGVVRHALVPCVLVRARVPAANRSQEPSVPAAP